MKKLFTFLLMLAGILCHAQDRITFSYDTAGNQIQRKLCLGCLTSKSTETTKEIIALKEEDLIKFFPEDVISYYPNPVKEELYVKWELIDDNSVTSAQVYGLNGQILQSYSGLEKVNSQSISFQGYPSGVYAVVLVYNSGEQKTIKIIKQ